MARHVRACHSACSHFSYTSFRRNNGGQSIKEVGPKTAMVDATIPPPPSKKPPPPKLIRCVTGRDCLDWRCGKCDISFADPDKRDSHQLECLGPADPAANSHYCDECSTVVNDDDEFQLHCKETHPTAEFLLYRTSELRDIDGLKLGR